MAGGGGGTLALLLLDWIRGMISWRMMGSREKISCGIRSEPPVSSSSVGGCVGAGGGWVVSGVESVVMESAVVLPSVLG